MRFLSSIAHGDSQLLRYAFSVAKLVRNAWMRVHSNGVVATVFRRQGREDLFSFGAESQDQAPSRIDHHGTLEGAQRAADLLTRCTHDRMCTEWMSTP